MDEVANEDKDESKGAVGDALRVKTGATSRGMLGMCESIRNTTCCGDTADLDLTPRVSHGSQVVWQCRLTEHG